MPEAMLEIVELENGDVVLRRADSSAGSSEPFVRVSFSQEANALINGQSAQLGKMMISMGLQAVARAHAEAIKDAIEKGDISEDELPDDDSSIPPNTRLH